MKVKCWKCGKEATVAITFEEYTRWMDGELIQNVVPHLPAAEREMLISKTCDDCFKALFSVGGTK